MISKKIKKLIMGITATMMLSSAIATSVQAREVNKAYLGDKNFKSAVMQLQQENENVEIDDIDFGEIEVPTFEEFLKSIGGDIKKEDIKKLEGLYNKAISLEDTEKFEEASKVWDEIYKILDKYMPICVECEDYGINELEEQGIPTIQDILGEETKKLDKEQIKKLEKLYSEIIKYEEEKKYTEADSLWQELENLIQEAGIFSENGDFAEEMSKLIASYEVKNNNIQLKSTDGENKKLSKEDIKKHKLMWDRAKQIIPKSYLNKIKRYEVVTDGKDNILAYVYPDDSNKVWTLSIDIKDAFDEKGKLIDKDLNETIIHEFGHVLTLNNEQVIPEHKEKSSTYTTDEGTTKKNAYLNLFYKKFWANIYDDYKKLNKAENNEEDGQPNLAFYEKYSNQFVSGYASTNPEEDIAESFRTFVTENKPQGKTIAEKKMLFFYDFPELVKIRKEIRKNLGLK
ncbi:putative zinc-binding metallopeptidase [Clostridium ganghwense]|uniref:Zinc-binding metallopeptidase n=1 Tax=Clostridium ganghwense TaxID=312089 RepID=A0ABT4CTJ8_9CLOT|nr:putative zinc-binding metallopeptidase [Clostridium ganghwense]MCY6372243.1 putative zinc-binding metallopeptidase [Clostridium ganghwense]